MSVVTGSFALQMSLDAALERVEDSTWYELARREFDTLVASGEPFSSDDLCARIGRPPGTGCALGAIFAAGVRAGRVHVVGRAKSTRPEAQRRRIQLYQGSGA